MQGGVECHPWQRKICQKLGKRGEKLGKIGKKRGKIGKKWQKSGRFSFTLPLLIGLATLLHGPIKNFMTPYFSFMTLPRIFGDPPPKENHSPLNSQACTRLICAQPEICNWLKCSPEGVLSVKKWVQGCAAQIGCFFSLAGLPIAPFFIWKLV